MSDFLILQTTGTYSYEDSLNDEKYLFRYEIIGFYPSELKINVYFKTNCIYFHLKN